MKMNLRTITRLKRSSINYLRTNRSIFVSSGNFSNGSETNEEISPETLSGKTIFSGIQPTGVPHIGNYLGALKQWVQLQNTNNVIYCIVDLHSITTNQKPDILRQNIRDMAMCMLACGLDPKKSVLFQQSMVPQHSELSWILSCLATLPQLSHQPQWRDKSQSVKDPSVGLYTYPILQSSDILLYKASHVPVGDDQIKHIELTRHLARTFNKRYNNFFTEPKAIVTSSKRVRNLKNPTQKMSKSDENEKSRIDLTDSDDVIKERIKKAVTDALGKLTYDPELRPGVSNLIDIHSGFTDENPDEICENNSSRNMSAYKAHLAEILIEKLKPIRDEYVRLKSDQNYVDQVFRDGNDRAREIAAENLDRVKKLVGFS